MPKRCFCCLKQLEDKTRLQCDKCVKNEQKYGPPVSCHYCHIPAAFVDRKCVFCTYQERKMGPPVPCSLCSVKCAFAFSKSEAESAVCRLCLLKEADNNGGTPPRKVRKRTATPPPPPLPIIESFSLRNNDPDIPPEIKKLKDEIDELRSQIIKRDHDLLERNELIARLQSDISQRDKSYRQCLQQLHKLKTQVENQRRNHY